MSQPPTVDAKAIATLGADLTKAASANEPASVLLSILSKLRKVSATEDLLRSTKIGIIVNKQKASKDKEVSTAAAEVVAKWRRDVKGPDGGKAAATAQGVKAGGSAPPKAGAVKEDGGKAFKGSVALDKRTSITDGVDTNVTGNEIRDNCLKLMYDGLAHTSSEGE
jgi:transcription elongation factor S-II